MNLAKGISSLVALVCAPLVILALNAPSLAETRVYQAAMHEADWSIESSVFECRLQQSIPRYGEVQFAHRAGENLELRIMAYSNLLADDSLRLRSIPPPWNFQRSEKDLGEIQLADDNGNLRLDSTMARRLMSEMLVGMVPVISGVAEYDASQPVNVALSPLHFQMAYNEYQQCSGNLLPVNLGQVQRSTIFFKSNQRQLEEADYRLLDNIVLYSKADPSISGFEVDSFTDTAGERRENLLISEERAFAVTNYLVSRGVDPETIATRAHGEREEYLMATPERTAADRDRNRRVNVVLVQR